MKPVFFITIVQELFSNTNLQNSNVFVSYTYRTISLYTSQMEHEKNRMKKEHFHGQQTKFFIQKRSSGGGGGLKPLKKVLEFKKIDH